MEELELIKKRIEENKFEEALDLLAQLCLGPLAQYGPTVSQLKGRLSNFRQNVIIGVSQPEEVNDLRNSILLFVYKLASSHIAPQKIQQLFNSSLVVKNSFPFVDRTEFRKIIDKALNSDGPFVVLVNGKPKTGMSHLEKFLDHLSEHLNIVQVIPCEVPMIVDGPNTFLGEQLAKYLSIAFDMEMSFDPDENAHFKFVQFINNLKKKIRSKEKIPLFFLHDFHKIEEDNANLLELIYNLIKLIDNDFPKSIFIIAGLRYDRLRNWHSDLKFTTPIYNLEPISETDLEHCLKSIYALFHDRIIQILGQPIREEEYIEQMVKQIIGTNGAIDITIVGMTLADHLYTLKN